MKKALLALVIFAVSFSTFAETNRPRPGHHRRPGRVIVVRPRPVPRPMPSRSCQVVMTDRMNRVVRRYWGHEDYHSMCRSGLRQCNYDLNRMGMWGYRCATVRW